MVNINAMKTKFQFNKDGNKFPDCVPFHRENVFLDLDGEKFVNESDEPEDSNQRVAVIITDGVDAIVGKSP